MLAKPAGNRVSFVLLICLPLLLSGESMRKSLILFTAHALAVLTVSPGLAADWGYEEPKKQPPPPEVEPMRAVAQPIAKPGALAKKDATPATKRAAAGGAKTTVVTTGAPAGSPFVHTMTTASVKPVNIGKTGSGKAPVGAPHTVPGHKSAGTTGKLHAASQSLVQECWSQVYEIGTGKQLTDEQRSELDQLINQRLAAGSVSAAEANAVLSFWPKVGEYLVAHPDQRENYGLLLHALLRYRARNQNAYLAQGKTDALIADESAFIAEVLGPVRLSVGGVVPFSEDALNAYTDMACFVYEQQHPGKSVDAADNRDLFGMIIAKKFKEAPTQKDQEAMSGFDLAWAKFKIAWTAADAAHRSVLLDKLVTSGAGVAWAEGRDATLDSVLSNWPGARSTSASASSASPHK
jgi:hypothetical protein